MTTEKMNFQLPLHLPIKPYLEFIEDEWEYSIWQKPKEKWVLQVLNNKTEKEVLFLDNFSTIYEALDAANEHYKKMKG